MVNLLLLSTTKCSMKSWEGPPISHVEEPSLRRHKLVFHGCYCSASLTHHGPTLLTLLTFYNYFFVMTKGELLIMPYYTTVFPSALSTSFVIEFNSDHGRVTVDFSQSIPIMGGCQTKSHQDDGQTIRTDRQTAFSIA